MAALMLCSVLSMASCSGNDLVFQADWDGCWIADVNNTKMKKLVIPAESPKGATVIGIFGDIFTECSKLESVTIPSTVTQIDGFVFNGCTSLTSITVEEGNPVYHSNGNCIIETETNILVAGCKGSVIPDYVTEIGYGAFAGTGIESVELHEGVKYISWGAFKNCRSLRSVHIPATVESIDSNSLFHGCRELESITVAEGNPVYFSIDNCLMEPGRLIRGCKTSIIPKVAVEIADYAFAGASFTSITIPNNVRYMGKRVFEDCPELRDIYYNGTQAEWTSTIDKCDEEYFEWDNNMSGEFTSSYTLHFEDGDLPVSK